MSRSWVRRKLLLLILATASTPYLAYSAEQWHAHVGSDGYRMRHYRAPTPAQAPHAITVSTSELLSLIDTGAFVLVDVQAVVERPETQEFGFAWLPNETRLHIPGSTWLPNVGKGALTPRMDTYFRDNLQRLTGGAYDKPLVFYCVADCWMSWNAVQRAHSYGYRRLYWYRDGTDGWGAAGMEAVEAEPVPLDSSDGTGK